jgi:hypothetical protein
MPVAGVLKLLEPRQRKELFGDLNCTRSGVR